MSESLQQPGFSLHGIFPARKLEWEDPLLQGSSWAWDQTCISCIQADSLPLSPWGAKVMPTKAVYMEILPSDGIA